MRFTTKLPLAPKLRMRSAIPLLTLDTFMACTLYTPVHALYNVTYFISAILVMFMVEFKSQSYLFHATWLCMQRMLLAVYRLFGKRFSPIFKGHFVSQDSENLNNSAVDIWNAVYSFQVYYVSPGMSINLNNSFSKIYVLFYCLLIRYHVSQL
jgi:hypothetical protein